MRPRRLVLDIASWWYIALVACAVLPMALLGLWFSTWTVDLRCEHRGPRTIHCEYESYSFVHYHASESTMHDVQGIENTTRYLRSGSSARGTSRRVIGLEWIVPSGNSTVPIANDEYVSDVAIVDAGLELQSFAQTPEAPPVSIAFDAHLLAKLFAASLLLLVPWSAWLMGGNTLVVVDHQTRELAIHRRRLFWSKSRTVFPLHEVTGVSTRYGSGVGEILLECRHRDPQVVATSPARKAEIDAGALWNMIFTPAARELGAP